MACSSYSIWLGRWLTFDKDQQIFILTDFAINFTAISAPAQHNQAPTLSFQAEDNTTSDAELDASTINNGVPE